MAKALSAQDIEKADFTVSLRGYDRDEVEAFLQSIAEEHRRLADELGASRRKADKPYQGLGADMGALLQHAKDSADELRHKAEEDAKQIRQEAKNDAQATKEKADRDGGDVRKAADYDASERTKEAERHVGQLRQAEAEARKRLDDVRAELAAVIERLEHVGSTLHRDPASPTTKQAPTEAEVPTADAGHTTEEKGLQEREKSPAA